MNAPQTQEQKGNRTAFIINTVIGEFFLLLSAAAYFLEMKFPDLRGTLVWPCMITAVGSLFAAALCHNRWLHAQRHGEPEAPRTALRRTSSIKWFGLPLYDIYFPAPSDDIKSVKAATARGVFAAGMSAKGIVAVGVLAGGVLAIAPYAFGVVAIGYVAAGVGALGWKVLASVGTQQ